MPDTGTFTRRGFLAGAAGLAACSRPAAGKKPNFVIFLADDMGYGDLPSYGAPDIRAPHIEAIGEAGCRFTQAYANAPQCTPTRAALLSGRYQQRFGGLECAIGVGNVGRYDEAIWLQKRDELGLPADPPTMGRIFKRHGYDTACFGKWHLGYLEKFSPNRHGFDEFFGILGGNADYFTHREYGGWPVLYHNGEQVEEEGYMTELIARHAVEWLDRRQEKPFLLYVPFTAPHTPVQGPEDAGKKITEENWNQGDRATYCRMVEAMDEAVGRILAKVREVSAGEETYVVFASDNGGYKLSRNDPFRGGKSYLWEGGVRVPLLIQGPGIPAGSETEQVALTMDLLPTFLSAAALPSPPASRFDGVDLMGVLRGEREPFQRTVFWRYKRAKNRRKAVRHGNMKYLWDNGEEYLFNLSEDIREEHNLLEDFPGVAAELKDKLAAWEEEVRAPRLAEFPG